MRYDSCMKKMIVLAIALVSCGDTPRESLLKKHRPEPITCVSSGLTVCTHGAGVVWTCDGADQPEDSECIVTGSVSPELK